MSTRKTPAPKPTNIVCAVCERPWDLHKADAKGKVGLDECVRLLKDELAKRPKSVWNSSAITPVYYPATISN